MANHSEVQFPTGSTTFFTTYFDSIVSTINESMTEKPAESTILSTFLDSTTKSQPKCEKGFSQCDDHASNPCNTNNGICCTLNGEVLRCICKDKYIGKFCQRKIAESSGGIEGAQLTAVISGLIGVLVISLFVGVVVLQYKYYKKRKQRLQKDEEVRKSMRVKPEIRRRDDASTRLLRTQPGYSWRQSVKRSTYVSQKSNGLSMSISVPENLFEIGLTKEHEKETNLTKICDGEGGKGGGGGGGGGAEGSEIFRIDPVDISSTAQLLKDKDPSTMAVQFDSKSDVIHL